MMTARFERAEAACRELAKAGRAVARLEDIAFQFQAILLGYVHISERHVDLSSVMSKRAAVKLADEIQALHHDL